MNMDRNSSNLSTAISRYSEYTIQRGMRWISNFTADRTLSRMTVPQAYEYLNRKTIAAVNSRDNN